MCHDFEDAVFAGIVDPRDLPAEVADVVEDSVDDAKQAEKTATTRARASKSGNTSSGS